MLKWINVSKSLASGSTDEPDEHRRVELAVGHGAKKQLLGGGRNVSTVACNGGYGLVLYCSKGLAPDSVLLDRRPPGGSSTFYSLKCH